MSRKFPVAAPPSSPPSVTMDPTPVAVPIHRVIPTDIERLAGWAVPMIQEDFGNPPLPVIQRWMRAWAMDNQYSFVATDNAVGLSTLVYEPLFADPIVQNIFLYVRNGAKNEGIELYKHFYGWMKLNRAVKFRFHDSAGQPTAELKSVFGNLQYQKMWYADAQP